MRTLLALVQNETLKVIKRRRFRLVLCVLAALLSLFTLARHRQQRQQLRDNPSGDWRPVVEKRASDMERRLASRRIPEGWARFLRYESGRLRYHLKHGINPDEVTGPAFARGFAGFGSLLLIPLLVAVLGSDIVSSEFSQRTASLLLTRPVARWKVLLSKLAAMVLFTTLTVAAGGLLAWAISGVTLGWRGWGAPILTGFRLDGQAVEVEGVRSLPLWLDTIAAYGLAWASALSVGAVTILLSVVFRSTAAAMGTMMATLIGGTILSRVASDWEGAKWLFVSNLPLPEFYAGMPPPFPGMTLAFSVKVLAAWAAAATAAAFVVFARKDVT